MPPEFALFVSAVLDIGDSIIHSFYKLLCLCLGPSLADVLVASLNYILWIVLKLSGFSLAQYGSVDCLNQFSAKKEKPIRGQRNTSKCGNDARSEKSRMETANVAVSPWQVAKECTASVEDGNEQGVPMLASTRLLAPSSPSPPIPSSYTENALGLDTLDGDRPSTLDCMDNLYYHVDPPSEDESHPRSEEHDEGLDVSSRLSKKNSDISLSPSMSRLQLPRRLSLGTSRRLSPHFSDRPLQPSTAFDNHYAVAEFSKPTSECLSTVQQYRTLAASHRVVLH